jgi:hypothetical protein
MVKIFVKILKKIAQYENAVGDSGTEIIVAA